MLTILIGKSASGKDSVARELIENHQYEPFLSYTTRPMREGEIEGRDYHFISDEEFDDKFLKDQFLETRSYQVIENGKASVWKYATPKQELEENRKYIRIVDVEGCRSLLNHYGREKCFVVYLEADDAVREQRAMKRGGFEKAEWDRRAKDDDVKFAKKIVNGIADLVINTSDSNVPKDNPIAYFADWLDRASAAYGDGRECVANKPLFSEDYAFCFPDGLSREADYAYLNLFRRSDDDWEYNWYDRDFREYDEGGIYDDPDATVQEVLQNIAEDAGLFNRTSDGKVHCVPVGEDWLSDRIMDAEIKAAVSKIDEVKKQHAKNAEHDDR